MFEQTFKNIGDILWKEAGCQSEVDYAKQVLLTASEKYFSSCTAMIY
jgi:type I restriction enzyme M protein